MTATGTNLLGLVKHVASVQLGYFAEVFNRPHGRELPWHAEGAEADADMWATPEESRQSIIDLHHLSAAHSDETIRMLPLDAVGEVPWWSAERRRVTLQQILVHVAVETARHSGHADILREMLDGAVGNGPADPNIPQRTVQQRAAFFDRLEAAARQSAEQK